MPPQNARITPTAETMPPRTATRSSRRRKAPPRNAPRSSRHRKARPRDASCSKRAEAVPSQNERAPSGTRPEQSRSEIASLAPKQRHLAPRLRQTVRRGVFSPNGAMHAMGRRDAPSEAKRHDAGRRGVSAANGRGSPVLTPRQTGVSPVLTPQPSLAATKHPRTNPRPQRNKRHAAANRRVPYVNAAAVLGCAQMRSKNAPPNQNPTKPTTK